MIDRITLYFIVNSRKIGNIALFLHAIILFYIIYTVNPEDLNINKILLSFLSLFICYIIFNKIMDNIYIKKTEEIVDDEKITSTTINVENSDMIFYVTSTIVAYKFIMWIISLLNLNTNIFDTLIIIIAICTLFISIRITKDTKEYPEDNNEDENKKDL